MKTVLTIAGSDCSGGAGIQADLKTMMTHVVYGMSAITSLTAQNTMGVHSIFNVPVQFLADQLDAVFTDIYPDAIKIGMIATSEMISCVANKLQAYNAVKIVVDPVMVSTSGSKLIEESAIKTLKEKLLPLATLITPNKYEVEILSRMAIIDENDMKLAAQKMFEQYGCSILIKGGHLGENARDLLYANETYYWFSEKRIANLNTHGTGCTLSSAIAANLAKGESLVSSVNKAKEYVTGAIADMLDLGKGRGPLNHAYRLKAE